MSRAQCAAGSEPRTPHGRPRAGRCPAAGRRRAPRPRAASSRGRPTYTAVMASSGIDPPGPPGDDAAARLECDVGPHMEVTFVGEGRALAAGFHFLHGAAVEVGDRLGIAAVEAYFPSPLALKVFPRSTARA